MRSSLAELHKRADTRAVLALALPAVGNSLLQTMVFLVDRMFLGHHSEASLAAMQTAGPVTWTAWSVFGAFSAGTVAAVGRSVGERDPSGATQAARASVALGLCAGLALALTLGFFSPQVIALFGEAGGPEVRAAAASYVRVMALSMPFFFVGLACISALQAGGDTRTPFVIGVATNAVNALVNYALVFGKFGMPRLGATGSALATTTSGGLEAALALWALSRAGSKVTLRGAVPWGRDLREGLRRVLSVAYGSFAEKATYHVGYLLFSGFAVALGAHAMAANQALISVESVSFLTAEGFAVAAGALAAQRLGARDPGGARAAGWLTALLVGGTLAFAGLAFALFPSAIVRVFRDDPRIVAVGVPALRVGALAQVPMGVSIVLSQALRGAGATRVAFVVSTACAFVVRLTASYLFVRVWGWGLAGLWTATTLDWCVRCVAYCLVWRSKLWER